jgi:cell division protein FtsN
MAALAPAKDSMSKAAAKPVSRMGCWVQVGAFKNRKAGEQFLAAIRKAHAGTVKGHDLILREAQLSGRGTFHLARLGPFPRSGSARRACNAIKAGGASCFVIRQRQGDPASGQRFADPAPHGVPLLTGSVGTVTPPAPQRKWGRSSVG